MAIYGYGAKHKSIDTTLSLFLSDNNQESRHEMKGMSSSPVEGFYAWETRTQMQCHRSWDSMGVKVHGFALES